ncbi:MAG: hypothetical protein ICV77_06600 [Cyanobacteria bacterium Co-bin8]|nr:hypothetical protein [Cyanobacteria bacterium Co-bin8]
MVLLYFALRGMVKFLKAILDADLQEKVKKYLFGSPWKAMAFGLVITIAVQSSSITTSVIIPLIALGVVVALQALPYFLGANIGTSTTALIAALALSSDGNTEGVAALRRGLASNGWQVATEYDPVVPQAVEAEVITDADTDG